jgi:hypothetical protein
MLDTMTRLHAALILAITSSVASAVSPVKIIEGPPARLEMKIHGDQHDIVVTLPPRCAAYGPSKIVVELSTSMRFQVELATSTLSDGRIRFRVIADPSLDSLYYIRILDKSSEPWHELHRSTLRSISRGAKGATQIEVDATGRCGLLQH